MPQGYNSTLLGTGGAGGNAPGTGITNASGSFSNLLGIPTPGTQPNYGASALEPPGGWAGKTGAQLQNTATTAGIMGLNNLGAASSALSLPLNYWAAILSGNPSAIMQAEAPAVNTVLSQYDTARKTAANLSPRGGGQIESMTKAPQAEAGQISNIVAQSQPTAASAITSNAALLGQLGQGETTTATSSLNDILNFILGQESAGAAKTALSNQQGQQIGGAIAQILPVLLGAA